MNASMERKKLLEDRLSQFGIHESYIDYQRYLDFDETGFATSYDVGCRLMILYAVSYTASEPGDAEAVKEWLTREHIWEHVSPTEKTLFEGEVSNEQQLIEYSWQGECAYLLAWCLNLVNENPDPSAPVNEDQANEFMDNLPGIGEKLDSFLSHLHLRHPAEIHDERIFYFLATAWFRDHLSDKKAVEPAIDPRISYLRHTALSWLCWFPGINMWDETETST